MGAAALVTTTLPTTDAASTTALAVLYMNAWGWCYSVVAERQRRQLLEQRQRVSAELQQEQLQLQQQLRSVEGEAKKRAKSREEQRRLLRRFEIPAEDIVAVRFRVPAAAVCWLLMVPLEP